MAVWPPGVSSLFGVFLLVSCFPFATFSFPSRAMQSDCRCGSSIRQTAKEPLKDHPPPSPISVESLRVWSWSGPSLASCLLPISMRALLARPLTLDLDLVHLLLRSTQVSCLSFHPSPLHSSPRVPGFPSPNRHAAIASKIWPAHLAPLRRILLNQLLLACILRILPRVGL